MNKTEKIVSILLGLLLVWALISSRNGESTQEVQEEASASQEAASEAKAAQGSLESAPGAADQKEAPRNVAEEIPATPAEYPVLENDDIAITLSTHGGAVVGATLKKYNLNLGEAGDSNPPIEFDFSDSRLGEISVPGVIGAKEVYQIVSSNATELVLENERRTARRKVTLQNNYNLVFEDEFPLAASKTATLGVGAMQKGIAEGDLPSIDSWSMDKGSGRVVHHNDDDSPLKPYLGVSSGGCSCAGAKSALGYKMEQKELVPGAQKWIALKNQFFVTALVDSTAANKGFEAYVRRADCNEYIPEQVCAKANMEIAPDGKLTSRFFLGPKKQALLWDQGMRDVMDFGMWRWICYPIVWILNVFYAIIPNYGIAIILLTILVRLIFWPLTHKSTVGMKKMQEIQPLMKEVQAKFKDNPQRMQQEIFALYREHKVNPLSSCLPMLVQIPVFIALFNVLRAAVELRYASFLWISDLSQPEHLFSSWFPWFGGLNILPILMAVTMGLQSALTPSTGDDRQKKMMTIFMPAMMLVMFYNFASALSLYWTLSQLISILQMWLIKRAGAKSSANGGVEVVESVVTRQMRRHN